jgi:Type I restriction modification DNA specificity domain
MKQLRLIEVADISPGFSTPGAIQHEPGGRFLVIQPKHIHETGRSVSFGSSHDTWMDLPDRAAGYCVSSGDVLFMSRGEKNRAARIDACVPNAVPTVAFFVLRPRGDVVDAGYLAWFLNQAPTQAAISQVRTGAGTPMVQRALFEDLTIPLPPLATQRKIADLSALQHREHELMERLALAVSQRNRGIGINLLSNVQ